MDKNKLKEPHLWTFKSNHPMLTSEWRSYNCLSLSREQLIKDCVERYGRVPTGCIPIRIKASSVPSKFNHEVSIELSQIMYKTAEERKAIYAER